MTAPHRDRQREVEVNWSGQPAAVAWVGDRLLHSFWPVLAPYFRDVLLPPHRRDEEQVVAWHWTEVPGAPTARELAALRQRLRRDGEIFAEALEAGGKASARTERRGAADARGLAPAVRHMVDELAALPDSELAVRAARTESGLRLHSWGATRAAAQTPSAARAGKTPAAADARDRAAGSEAQVASARAVPSRNGRRRWVIASAALALLATGAGGWRFLRSGASSPGARQPVVDTQLAAADASGSLRRALVHAGDRGERTAAERGPAGEVATVGASLVSSAAAKPPANAAVLTASSSVPGSVAQGSASDGDFESGRDVAVARDTARPAAGAPAARSTALTAGSGAVNRTSATAVPASAAGGPLASGTPRTAGAAGGRDSGAAENVGPQPPASRPPTLRPAPVVSPPAAVDASAAGGRTAEPEGAATAGASSFRPVADRTAHPGSGREKGVSEESLPPERSADGAVADREAGVGRAAGDPDGSRRRNGRSKEGRPFLAESGTAGALEPDAKAWPPGDPVVATLQDGHLAAEAGRAEAGLSERWSVEFQPAGTHRVRAVILPTLPLPEGEADSLEALQARLRREAADSCPTVLRAARWRQAIVLAGPEGDARTGWSWRTGPASSTPVRATVEDGRAVWEAPPAGTAVAGRWRLVDGSGRVRAEVETYADHSLRVTVSPGVRAWQRLALASEDGAARPVNELVWQTPSGGALPPAAQIVIDADTPAGGWIELPLAANRALIPDTLALVDRRSGWAALVRRRAAPAELTATR